MRRNDAHGRLHVHRTGRCGPSAFLVKTPAAWVAITESDLVLNLSSPCALADTSWIKPGIASWDWWSQVSRPSTASYEELIQFSADMGWAYTLLDAGWSGRNTIVQVSRSVNMDEVLAFTQATNQPSAPPTQINAQKRLHVWWREGAPGQRTYTADNKKMPLIAVKGNRFVDPHGNTVLFRRLSISDSDKVEMQGHWNKDHFVKVKELGTKLVRIPIHPVAWRERTATEYIKLLDQAVGWCTELEMYVILDWHTIGNLETEVFQDPMYETSRQETYNFWRSMARRSSSISKARALVGRFGASIRNGGRR